jgi:tetratricopeptide (TPR) repeat protein
LLTLAALVVFGLLPRWIAEPALRESESAAVGTDQVPPSASPSHRTAGAQNVEALPVEDPQPAEDRAAAERLLAQVLSLQQRADELAVERWGGAPLVRARAAAGEGDQQLASGRFDRAVEAYRTAVDSFEQLLGRAKEVLHESLERGEAALAGGDGAHAAEAFHLALAIDPNNP